jgi:DnaJ-domain-containing protein 1
MRTVWSARREWQWKAVGVFVGMTGGWFGVLLGLLVGYMLDELFKQGRRDRSVVAYLMNPGPAEFTEPVPGLAAYCALSVLVLSDTGLKRDAASSVVVTEVVRAAESVLSVPAESRLEIENIAREAFIHRSGLNPDLLAESLMARRARFHDFSAIALSFLTLAEGPQGCVLAERLASILAPEWVKGRKAGARRSEGRKAHEPHPQDRWHGEELEAFTVLGISPGASPEDIKVAFRKLAVLFHPDALSGLEENKKREAGEAFIRIERAYRLALQITSVEKTI